MATAKRWTKMNTKWLDKFETPTTYKYHLIYGVTTSHIQGSQDNLLSKQTVIHKWLNKNGLQLPRHKGTQCSYHYKQMLPTYSKVETKRDPTMWSASTTKESTTSYCTQKSSSVNNLTHMHSLHGYSIPDEPPICYAPLLVGRKRANNKPPLTPNVKGHLLQKPNQWDLFT
jgi:hypothetical protein